MENHREFLRAIWGGNPNDSSSMLAWVLAVVDRQQEEGLYLEFKRKSDPERGPLDDDDRTNLAKAISAFANVDGGLIVWGIEAKSDSKDEPDVARALHPIRAIRGFVAELNKLSAGAVSPPLPGIENRPVPIDPGGERGFAITIVPPRQEPLTQVNMGRRHRGAFFLRTGSGSFKIDQPFLTQLINRRPGPLLALELDLQDPNDTTIKRENWLAEHRERPAPGAPKIIDWGKVLYRYHLRVGWTAYLVNRGLGSAREVALAVDVSGAEESELCHQASGGLMTLPNALHPGQRMPICRGKLLLGQSALETGANDLTVFANAYAADSPHFELHASPTRETIQLYLPAFLEKAGPAEEYIDRPEWLEEPRDPT